MIDMDSRLPLYYQLMDIIIEKINKGELKDHDKLPSERQLCEQYNVSRTTVRQTMQELEKEKLIYKKHGKGSFVSPKVINQSLVKFYSFTEEMKKINKTPSTKVIKFEVIKCEGKLTKKMGLAEGELLYKVTRLRLADHVPMLYETSYLPVSRFPGLKETYLEKIPMYNIFNDKYQTEITGANERFQVTIPTDEEAKQLKINKGAPCLHIERVTHEGSSVIEYTSTIARGDKFTYFVELK
ncbi:GntR family transcriptional regulator [Lederbergia citri]|uniref:GntR family transcriptional regulator n=1 Tax=Lederbergia citri TaxID=2833580 RepID=A0A942THI6_9BACI|nr:GntR family transcriptional regulator [Lederbergia citri]MBS4197708.1 GntR family transcriptional regulator [Lederbergia citri]